jgi:hypothetical protein
MSDETIYQINHDYGVGYGAADGRKFIGVRGSAEKSGWRVSAAVGSTMQDDQGDELALGGSLARQIIGSSEHLVFVDAQAGLAYTQFGGRAGRTDQVDIPLGLGIGLSIPNPFEGAGEVAIWIAPRGHLRSSGFRASGPASRDFDEIRGGFGASLGVLYIHGEGIGIDISFEWMRIRSAAKPEWLTERTFGLGLLFAW